MAQFEEEEIETETEAEETPAPAAGMSNSDMLSAALVALAPALVGGLMGGKQGAMAGGAAGFGAAGGAMKSQADSINAANAAAAKREQSFADFQEREDYKKKNAPGPKAEARRYKGKDGKTREGVVDPKTDQVIMAETDPIVEPAPVEKPPKDITVSERNTLQTQYDRDPDTRKNRMVMSSYADAQALAADDTPAADQALVFAYMKALDPTSVVRESEAESAQALGSLSERAKAKFESMAGDGRLTDTQRKDLLNQVKKLAQSAAKKQAATDKDFLHLASKRGVAADDLRFAHTPEFGDEPKQETTAGLQVPYSPKYTEELQAKAQAILDKRKKEREQAGKGAGKNGG